MADSVDWSNWAADFDQADADAGAAGRSSGRAGDEPNYYSLQTPTYNQTPLDIQLQAAAKAASEKAQEDAKNAQLIGKGVSRTQYDNLTTQQQVMVDRPDFNLKPTGFGSYQYDNAKDFFKGQEANLVSSLIDRGVTKDSDLEEAVNFAMKSGSLQNVNTFNGFIDSVNQDFQDQGNWRPRDKEGEFGYSTWSPETIKHQGTGDRSGFSDVIGEPNYNPDYFRWGPSPLDAALDRGNARERYANNPDFAISDAMMGWIGSPLNSVPTIGSALLGMATGERPVGQMSKYGLDFGINQSTRGANEGAYLSSYQDLNNADYGSDSAPQRVVQNLDPNVAAGVFNREAALEELIGRTQGNTTNPGIGDYYFNDIIRRGLTGRNTALGDNIDENQFNNAFSSNFLGQGLLDDETTKLQGNATDSLNNVFTGNAFSIDDSIIDSIVNERAQPARQQISTSVARGNFNPTGGRTANESIDFQTPQATSRVKEIGAGVLGGYQGDVGNIKDSAMSSISGFKLGDDLFDVAPFAEQRSKLIQDRGPMLQGDISDAIGNEPLFNSGEALAKGGRVQGVVSGQPSNQSFLDSIAARETQGARSGRSRGLGSRGSGAF